MTDIGNESAVALALLNLTERGSLVWEEFTSEDEELPQSPDVPDDTSLFVTFHRGMDLYLWTSDGESGREKSSSTRLKVVDPEANVGWAFPPTGELEDLYELVQFRQAGLKDWMREVIEEASQENPSSEDTGAEETEAEEPEVEAEADKLEGNQPPAAPSWSEESSETDSSGESETVEAESAEEDADALSDDDFDEHGVGSAFEGSENGTEEEGHVL